VSRRHAYLTLEHLLYALAHDAEGERILQGCGADLPRLRKELNQYLDESVEQLKRGHEREPEQTAAFQRVLQTAVLHVQSAQRAEVHAGDILAAIMQQPKSHASRLLQNHGISRLDVLDFISHGISKVPPTNGAAAPERGRRCHGGRGPRGARPRRAIRSRRTPQSHRPRQPASSTRSSAARPSCGGRSRVLCRRRKNPGVRG
jgi:ATP-dependent Clp protease ATP-binding subunit ClpA